MSGSVAKNLEGRTGEPLFSTQDVGKAHIITLLESEIADTYYIDQVVDDIARHVESIDTQRLVVDLRHVTHLSSAALHLLMALKVILDQRDGRMCITNLERDLQEVFRWTKLKSLMPIFETTDEAIANMTD